LNALLAKVSEHAAHAMHLRALMHRFSLWAALWGLLLWAGDASPRVGATLVALVTTDPTAELSHRVEEQLEALGFDVVVLNPPATGSVGPMSLEQAARNVGAIAAVRIVPMAQSVQVWTADPVTGQSVFRELLPPAGQKPSDAAVALGAVELLRASLLELHPPEPIAPPKPPQPAPTCPPAVVAPPEKTPEPRLGVTVGLGMDLGLAGRPSVAWELAAWVRLQDRFGLRAFALVDASPANVTAASDGNVDVATQLYGAELTYDLRASSSTWVPVVGLGVADAVVSVRGVAASTGASNLYESTGPWPPVVVPFAHLGGSWAPLGGLRLRADLLGGVSTRSEAVCVQATSSAPCTAVAHWGQPLVNASLGLEVLLSP
jgi:hypothetical protein